MLLLLNYLLQIGTDVLQLAQPQVSLTPHRHMVWANYLKIVCFLWGKCEYSVYIDFILQGNQWGFGGCFLLFCFILVKHEKKMIRLEIDLFPLTIGHYIKVTYNSLVSVFATTTYTFSSLNPFLKIVLRDSNKVGEMLKFNHGFKILICYVMGS